MRSVSCTTPGPQDAPYRGELAAIAGVRVLHGFTRSSAGELTGHFDAAHLPPPCPIPGGLRLRAARAGRGVPRALRKRVASEKFPAHPVRRAGYGFGRANHVRGQRHRRRDDGRPLLDQAEGAGLTHRAGCRMGICHTCTRRKHRGAVRNLTTGAVSTADDEDVQICVSRTGGRRWNCTVTKLQKGKH